VSAGPGRDPRGWSPVAEAGHPRPWYRQFWPWFLILLPATAVVGGITTLFIAMQEPDGLVVDDYYKAGLAINRVLQRRDEAQRLGVAATGLVDPVTGDVVLDLAGGGIEGAALRLRLAHATRARHDQVLELKPLAGGRVIGQLSEPLRRGPWDLTLEPLDGRWRVTGRLLVDGGSDPPPIRLAP
jgi:hypothetical protein